MDYKKHNNKIGYKFSRHLKPLLLSIIISLVIVIQPLAIVVTKVSAASKYQTFTIEDSLKSKQYFYAIESCLSSLFYETFGGAKTISKEDITNLNWFPAGMNSSIDGSYNVVPVGSLEKDVAGQIENGKLYCDENSNALLKQAFALWGLDINDVFNELVCSSAGVKDGMFYSDETSNSVSCASGSRFSLNGDFSDTSAPEAGQIAFKNYIVNKVYGGNAIFLNGLTPDKSPLTPEETYILNRNIFNDFCSANLVFHDTDIGTTTIRVDDIESSTKVSRYIDRGNTGYWTGNNIALWGNTSDNQYPLPLKTGATNGYAATRCEDVITNMNANIDAYIASTSPKAENKTLVQSQEETATLNSVDTQSCGSQMTGGMGWIMCPVITGLANLSDDVWGLVSGLLTVNPLTQTDSNGITGVYKAWGVIRNIANIAFVIVFLVMIFSQLSSAGISNYGIKKLLPRLVIGAILVNVSFLIIQIAVDLSNVIGSSLYDLMVSIIPAYQPTFRSMINQVTIVQGATVVAGGAALVVTFTGGITTALWLLLPVLVMAVLGLVAALLTLIFRKAAIIVLAILAPLAIVASLLPNTESWYKKWKDEFIQMLMLFPLAAIVFGGSQFAAGVIMSQNVNDWFNSLIAIIIVTLPLFSLPFLAKSSGKIVGAASKALTDLANKAKSPVTKWTGERADRAKNRENLAAMNGSDSNPYHALRKTYLRHKAEVRKTDESLKREYDHSEKEYIVNAESENAKLVQKMAGGKYATKGAMNRTQAAAVGDQKKLEQEDITNVEILLRAQTNPIDLIKDIGKQLDDAMKNGDTTRARAAQNILLTSGAPGIAKVRDTVGAVAETSTNKDTINKLRSDINAAGLKGKDVVLSAWGYSGEGGVGKTIDELLVAKTFEGLNAVELAGNSIDVLMPILKDGSGKVRYEADGITPMRRNAAMVSADKAMQILDNQNSSALLNKDTRAYFLKAAGRPVPVEPSSKEGIALAAAKVQADAQEVLDKAQAEALEKATQAQQATSQAAAQAQQAANQAATQSHIREDDNDNYGP